MDEQVSCPETLIFWSFKYEGFERSFVLMRETDWQYSSRTVLFRIRSGITLEFHRCASGRENLARLLWSKHCRDARKSDPK